MRLRIAKKIALMNYGTWVYKQQTRIRARRRYLKYWLKTYNGVA